MDYIVSKEDAEKKIEELEDFFEVTIDEGNRNKIITAISSGRLTFDEDKECFNLVLKHPINLENGDDITSLKLNQPTVQDIEKASRKNNDFDQMISIVSAISGQPIGIINKIKQRDILTIAAVLSFFG